jgi:hypothetical protein
MCAARVLTCVHMCLRVRLRVRVRVCTCVRAHQTPSNQSSLPLLDSSTFLCINPRSPDDSRTQQLTDAQVCCV